MIKNPFQSGNSLDKGTPLSADNINNLIYSFFDHIKAGLGIRVSRFDKDIIISTDGGNGRGGTSSIYIPIVATLPEIPQDAPQGGKIRQIYVYWGDDDEIEGGTGDSQIWATTPGQTRYYPLEKFTSKSGVPV